jgi:hypothetical protein
MLLGTSHLKAIGILTGQHTASDKPTVRVHARLEAADLEPDTLAVGQVESSAPRP